MVKNWVKFPNRGYYHYYQSPGGAENYAKYEPRNCLGCGELYLARGTQIKKGLGLVCSPRCRNHIRTKARPIKQCEWCGADYRPTTRQHNRRFCGLGCASKYGFHGRYGRVKEIYLRAHGLTELTCERCLYVHGTSARKVHLFRKNGVQADVRPGNLGALCDHCRLHLKRGGAWGIRYGRARERIEARREALRWTK